MLHPKQPANGPEPVGEEFIELYNRGTNAISLKGWRLTRGVDYVFGDVSMPAGGYLQPRCSGTPWRSPRRSR